MDHRRISEQPELPPQDLARLRSAIDLHQQSPSETAALQLDQEIWHGRESDRTSSRTDFPVRHNPGEPYIADPMGGLSQSSPHPHDGEVVLPGLPWKPAMDHTLLNKRPTTRPEGVHTLRGPVEDVHVEKTGIEQPPEPNPNDITVSLRKEQPPKIPGAGDPKSAERAQ